MLLSERAVLLNRIAAAEAGETGTLGLLLATRGRQTVLPRIAAYLHQVFAGGDDLFLSQAAEIWLALLTGDLQTRRITGALAEPTEAEIAERSANAARLLFGVFEER